MEVYDASDAPLLLDCRTRLSLHALEEPLYPVAHGNLSWQGSRQPQCKKIFATELEASQPAPAVRRLGSPTPPHSTPPRLNRLSCCCGGRPSEAGRDNKCPSRSWELASRRLLVFSTPAHEATLGW